jgi:hypothetical protein
MPWIHGAENADPYATHSRTVRMSQFIAAEHQTTYVHPASAPNA